MDHCGPLCRSAEDIALFLKVIAGFDPDDPGSEDVPVADYPGELNGGVRGLCLRLVGDWNRANAPPDLAPATGAVAELLPTEGPLVRPVELSTLLGHTDSTTTISSVQL